MDKQQRHKDHWKRSVWKSPAACVQVFFILPLELKTCRCIYVCEEMDLCHCVCLGQSIVPKVGKSFKLILVDLFDYTVVHWCQDRLFTCEILVEVIHIPFGFLETRTQYVYFSSENMTAADTSEARFANPTATVLSFSCILRVHDTQCRWVRKLTMRGLKGGLIFLCSNSVQSISRKKGWSLMASSSPWATTHPKRLLGLFVMNWKVKKKKKDN